MKCLLALGAITKEDFEAHMADVIARTADSELDGDYFKLRTLERKYGNIKTLETKAKKLIAAKTKERKAALAKKPVVSDHPRIATLTGKPRA